MTKKRNILIYAIILPLCFMLTLLTTNLLSLKANELNGSYNFTSTIGIDNNNYFISLTPNLTDERLQEYYLNLDDNTYDINIYINNIYYNHLFVRNNEYLGGIEIGFYNTETYTTYWLLRWYPRGEDRLEYINSNRFNIYFDDNTYGITTDETFNTFFYVSVKISGYYTFNQTLTSVHLPNNDFATDSYQYERINGSFVYQTENDYYLFRGLTYSYVDNYIIFDMYSSKSIDDLIIDSSFTNNNLRYVYFDNQYIDYYLYNWLENNGTFDFVYYNPKNASFWEIINAYINIPITIISSILSVSIFETGLTLLLVFATLITIVIAFKVVKMLNWV